MEQLIKIWKDVWGEEIDENQNSQRFFRLIEDILKEINKDEDKNFIKDTFSISRSLNVVAKKLYFEYAPIEKIQYENPFLINPKQLSKIDIKNLSEFQKELDPEYLEAKENNELEERICKNCSGVDNFIEEFDRWNNPILVCIENECNQEYVYKKPYKNQLKVPIHWLGLKYKTYNRNTSNFPNWVEEQTEPFRKREDLDSIEYDETGKKIVYFWENVEKREPTKRKKIINNSVSNNIDVFNKGGHWYYWVIGFKSFRFHQKHKNRELDSKNVCSDCRICQMDI